MLQVSDKSAAPKIINVQEECSLTEWQEISPDVWLLPEVTEETAGEPRQGRLIAVDSDDVNLMPLWQEYGRQGKITAMIHGVHTSVAPMVVA